MAPEFADNQSHFEGSEKVKQPDWYLFAEGNVYSQLYLCDPLKNVECTKEHCQWTCFHTTDVRYARSKEGSDPKEGSEGPKSGWLKRNSHVLVDFVTIALMVILMLKLWSLI
jgi:hypothetical protein